MGSSGIQTHCSCQRFQTFCQWQSLETEGKTWSPTTVQEHMEVSATAPPGCSGQMHDGFLVCCTSAFPASSQHEGVQGSHADFSMRTSNRPAFVYGISSLLGAALSLYSSHFNARCAPQLPGLQPQFHLPLSPLIQDVAKHRARWLSLCCSFT